MGDTVGNLVGALVVGLFTGGLFARDGADVGGFDINSRGFLGIAVGVAVGTIVGFMVLGLGEGCSVATGALVGDGVGRYDGALLGALVGVLDGAPVGLLVVLVG